MKKVNEWWKNLSLEEKTSFLNKIEERKAAALSVLELNWHKAKIIKIGKTKMLIPYSEKLQEYYFSNPKDKAKYDRINMLQ